MHYVNDGSHKSSFQTGVLMCVFTDDMVTQSSLRRLKSHRQKQLTDNQVETDRHNEQALLHHPHVSPQAHAHLHITTRPSVSV